MKIFNTMNKLCAAVAMTVGIAMSGSAQADLIYDGSLFTYSYWYHDQTTHFNSDTNIVAHHFLTDGVAIVSGDQDGLIFDFHEASGANWTDVVLSLVMTFDTATEITIDGSSWHGDSGTVEMPDFGTYTVDAGETFELVVDGFVMNNDYMEGTLIVDFTEVPAPGALALLGLAGIATRRRRK